MQNDILVVSATEGEVEGFIRASQVYEDRRLKSGKRLISGEINGKGYRLLISGVGVINTAHAVSVEVERVFPKLLIQAGICGAFKASGLKKGDMAIASQEWYVHAGVEASHTSVPANPLPFDLVEGAESSRKGILKLDGNLAQKACKILSRNCYPPGVEVRTGPFITVSTVTSTRETAEVLYNAYAPIAEAMEGAAAAHLALLYHFPFLEIRSVSNYVGERDKSAWDIPVASERVSLACIKLVQTLEMS